MLERLTAIHPLLPTGVGIAILVVAAYVAHLIGKRILLSVAASAAKRTRTTWDDALVANKVFDRLAHLVPALVVEIGINAVPDIPDAAKAIVHNVVSGWMIVAVILALSASLSAVNSIYESRPDAKHRPIKGFIQIGQILLYIVGAILVIAALIDRSPVILFSGLGAMTAVLLIVFKDTLLSLAASIQLTSQRMIRVGDWLEMPQFGADGDVIDVALYTVTVQNWDKTITTIPTYRLISDSFKNWRGMSEAGGRRIKRSINVDLNSIRFLRDAEAEYFRKFALLQNYIENKRKELQEYNDKIDSHREADVNLRRLTNIGTFRAYVYNYLKNHPKIHDQMTLIVRQLQPASEGLPIEIYCFTNDTRWAAYEGIQSDIFDHVVAIAPEFDLRLYQRPAGVDLARLTGE